MANARIDAAAIRARGHAMPVDQRRQIPADRNEYLRRENAALREELWQAEAKIKRLEEEAEQGELDWEGLKEKYDCLLRNLGDGNLSGFNNLMEEKIVLKLEIDAR